jgi:hypothetical protein
LTDLVTAEVVLRSPAGTSVVDATEPIDASTVGGHMPSQEAVAEAARRLAELGFDVAQGGPVTVTVRGEPELFERTFGTAGPGGEPEVPQGLRDVVAAVAFPQKPELF